MNWPVRMPEHCESAKRLVDLLVAAQVALPRNTGDALVEQTRAELQRIIDDPEAVGIEHPGFFAIAVLNEGPDYCEGSSQHELVTTWLEAAQGVTEASGKPPALPGPEWAWDLEKIPGQVLQKLKEAGEGAFPWLTVIAVVAIIVGLAYAWRTFVGRAA